MQKTASWEITTAACCSAEAAEACRAAEQTVVLTSAAAVRRQRSGITWPEQKGRWRESKGTRWCKRRQLGQEVVKVWTNQRNEDRASRRKGGREERRTRKIHQRQEWIPIKETNVLCAPRNHMVLLLTQRVTRNRLKCLEEVNNRAGLGKLSQIWSVRTQETKYLYSVSLVDHVYTPGLLYHYQLTSLKQCYSALWKNP